MDIGIITLLIIVANLIFSYKGFTSRPFFERYKFEVDRVLVDKEYKRLVSSGFLHVGWLHLLFNLFTLYAFGSSLEFYVGKLQYALIYFTALIGGNLFSLVIHRQHGDYSTVGASGAICGVIFASIALFPGLEIGFFGLPVSIPSWLFGLAFILFSIYGIRSKKDNIGHDAHLGGALLGLTLAIVLQPSALSENYLPILVIAVPAIFFIYMIITRPQLLLIDNYFFKAHKDFYSIDHKYNAEKVNKQKEIDRILEKIHTKGIGSLTTKEKQILKQHSQT